jgi:uncharacterized protein
MSGIRSLSVTLVLLAALSATSQNHTASTNSSIQVRHPALNSAQRRMMSAIRDGRTDIVQQLLREGLNPDFEVLLGPDCITTPLIEAVADEQPDMIALMLAKGSDANRGSKRCGGPLGVAAWYGGAKIVDILLRQGAEVDARDGAGATPLLLAASNAPDIETIQLLLRAGADIHAIDAEGNNALMLAAWNMNEETVQLFLKLGLDPCSRNNESESAADQLQRVITKDLKTKIRILNLLRLACAKQSS